jgi:hypothetical protein
MTTCGGDDFDWEYVVPRIVNPTKLKIIELLRIEGRPLSATRMKHLLGDDPEYTVARLHYHCNTLFTAGVLKLAGTVPRGAANERFYCLASGK